MTAAVTEREALADACSKQPFQFAGYVDCSWLLALLATVRRERS